RQVVRAAAPGPRLVPCRRCSTISATSASSRGAMSSEGAAKANLTVIEAVPEDPFYIPATALTSRPRRILKHCVTFIVLDSNGDIGASAGGTDRLFHCDTRFLSTLH